MKIHPQTIYNGKNPEFIVLHINEYKKILAALEELQDVQEIKQAIQEKGEKFPINLVAALSAGQNPIKVYREYRGLSQTNLAKKVNVSKQYISQLESGDRTGTAKILNAIAKALLIDISDLTD